MLELFAQEQLCTVPVKVQGYHSVEIKDAGVLLAYNDGTLLGVYGGSSEQLQKLQPAITALMQQPADKSIHANKHFTSMLQQKGDIRLLATPDALPMDVRGVLNWRMYATTGLRSCLKTAAYTPLCKVPTSKEIPKRTTSPSIPKTHENYNKPC